MDLEKAYDRVDREALWNVLRIYGMGGQLLKGIQAFYREPNACVRVEGSSGNGIYKSSVSVIIKGHFDI